jgi:hypothetical protein
MIPPKKTGTLDDQSLDGLPLETFFGGVPESV